MKYLLAGLVLWFLAVLHVSVMPYIKVLGVTPDLVLIFAACWTVLRSQEEALVVTPMAGAFHDLLTSDPLGTSILGLAPLVPLAAVAQVRAVETRFMPTAVVVLAGSFSYGVIAMTVLAVTGQELAIAQALFRVVLPLAIVNTLFLPILYMPISWVSPARAPVALGGRITSPL